MAPQAWHGGDEPEEYYAEWGGEGDYVAFYERMDIGPGRVVYTLYAYSDFWHYDHDYPETHTWNHSTADNNFLVGSQSHGGKWYKHFQFGVESNDTITNTAWEELNDNPSYYDGTNWRYVEGRVCNGTSSYITWIGTTPYRVGGEVYAGVNTKYTSNDMVCWKYTGTTISDDWQLWSGSGIVSDTVSTPYRVVATLEGHVSFQGRSTPPNDRWIEPFDVKLFEPGNLDNVLWEGTATTNNTGVFIITDLTPDSYDIGIKNWTCLSELETGVVLSGGEVTSVDFGTTREGDIDNNDWVYLGDQSALCSAWNTKPGDAKWNPYADLDRDGWVYLGDLSLLCTNWNQHGDLA